MTFTQCLTRVAEQLKQVPLGSYSPRSWEEAMVLMEWELEYLSEQILPLGNMGSDERWREQVVRLIALLVRVACNPPVSFDVEGKAMGA